MSYFELLAHILSIKITEISEIIIEMTRRRRFEKSKLKKMVEKQNVLKSLCNQIKI